MALFVKSWSVTRYHQARMESTVPEHLGIRISSDCKELDYREQTVTFVQLLLSMYPAPVVSLCCLKESQMVVLSVTSAER